MPVLIRLPELHVEPEPKADHEVMAAEDPPRATIPLLAATFVPGPSPALGAEPSRSKAGGAVSGETASTDVMPPPGRPRRYWPRIQPPRWAIRGGIALGLVAVLATAFLAIVGQASKSNPTVAEGETTSVAISPPSTVPADERPAPPTLPAPPAPPAPPTPPTSPTLDAAAVTPTSGSVAPDVAEKKQEPVTQPADAAGGNGGQAERPSAKTAESPPTSADPAPTPGSQDKPAQQEPTVPAVAVGGLNSGGQANVPALPAANAPQPLTSETPQRDAGAGVDSHNYPVTDPATFQYPPDYHLRLQRQARGPESLNAWPAPSGAGPSDRRPITARLQPRIEPPPMR